MSRDTAGDLAPIARKHPRWEIWQGVSGTAYARLLKSSPPIVVTAEDADGLDEAITTAMSALADRRRP